MPDEVRGIGVAWRSQSPADQVGHFRVLPTSASSSDVTTGSPDPSWAGASVAGDTQRYFCQCAHNLEAKGRFANPEHCVLTDWYGGHTFEPGQGERLRSDKWSVFA